MATATHLCHEVGPSSSPATASQVQGLVDQTTATPPPPPLTAAATATAASATPRKIHNPYSTPGNKNKRQRTATSSASPSTASASPDGQNGPAEESSVKLPNDISDSASTRFFAALLRSSVLDYVLSELQMDQIEGLSTAAATTTTTTTTTNTNLPKTDKSLEQWHLLCRRLDLPILKEPLPAKCDNPTLHFQSRAALVLEEARHKLSTTLANRWRKKKRKHNQQISQRSSPQEITSQLALVPSVTTDIVVRNNISTNMRSTAATSRVTSFRARVAKDKVRKHGIRELAFEVPWEADKVQRARINKCISEIVLPYGGAILECLLSSTRDQIHHAYLAILCKASQDDIDDDDDDGYENNSSNNSNHDSENFKQKLRQFSVMFFQEGLPTQLEGSHWTIRLAGQFLPLQREFCATDITDPCRTVPFLDQLLGTPPAIDLQVNMQPQETSNDNGHDNSDDDTARLNTSQKSAMLQFLHSPPKSITIVQGPPGTGKSSLLVSTMDRYFHMQRQQEEHRQLLVCAPTNKAISVLFLRYFDMIINKEQQDRCHQPNLVLVGNEAKLLEEEEEDNNNDNNHCNSSSEFSHAQLRQLRLCHAYQFQNRVVQELSDIALLVKKERKLQTAAHRARIVQAEIEARLSSDFPAEYKSTLESLCKALEGGYSGRITSANNDDDDDDDGAYDVETLLAATRKMMDDLPREVVRMDIMKSADVIFCTLCSSGSKIMQHVGHEDDSTDLIVDEAAAATEPALYIPFHCKPSRLLLVGDPKQLPSTVVSKRAKLFGLDRSLQERLMFRCGWEYNMLTVQYRMHPEISQFPSKRFYGNKLANGECVQIRGKQCPLLNGQPYTFLQVVGQEESEGENGSSYNRREAGVIVHLIRQLERCFDDKHWKSPDRVRIITFYKAQVALIRKCLKEKGLEGILVSTVDSAQGCEADLVIISFVKDQKVGFLNDNRRLNVALTRARHQLICVGNVSQFLLMYRADALKDLARDANSRGTVSNTIVNSSVTNQANARNKCLLSV